MKALLIALSTLLAVGCSEPTAVDRRMEELEEQLRLNPPDTTGSAARGEQYREQLKAAQDSWEIPGLAGCDPYNASTVAEHYVRRKLKSPGQAEFADHNDANVKNENGRISYVGYVDAPNSFNATQRMFFKVWMECREGGLAVVDAKLE